MPVITRLFDSREQAMAAVAELKQNGFSDDPIDVIGPAEGQGEGESVGASDDALLASITRTGVPQARAEAYAEGVRRGGTVVAVRAPFGFASTATEILDRFNPTARDWPEQDPSGDRPKHDPAAPLSSAAGWRVLLSDPTPLSSWLGWRVLSERQTPAIKLSDEPAPLSKRLGWRVLSENATPLSSRAGMKVLSDRQTPAITLSDIPAPLSSKLGWRSLLNDPAPLSSWLGWRLLLNNPTPLSSWLGWRMLSRD